VSWHEQGHQFSWQMMLRDKDGVAIFLIQTRQPDARGSQTRATTSPSGNTRTMVGRPEMLRLFGHHLERKWGEEHGTRDVEVRAMTAVSLNGRPSRPLVDPNLDLIGVTFSLWPADWLVDFSDEPLLPHDQRWLDDFGDALGQLIAEHGTSALNTGHGALE
jgi:hypothetical protein